MAEHRWRHPLQDLAEVRNEAERRLRQLRERSDEPSPPVTAGAWCPALDAGETADSYVFHLDLPGLAADDLEVSVDGRTLLIQGDRGFYADKSTDAFRRIERTFGRFDRRVRLPADARPDDISARYRDGVLTVAVAKAQESRRTTVTVT